jgi:hypothetical protein
MMEISLIAMDVIWSPARLYTRDNSGDNRLDVEREREGGSAPDDGINRRK